MTIRLTHSQDKRLKEVAALYGRPEESLIERTLSEVLSHLEEEFDAIAEADAQIARGETLTHEEVFARLNERMGLKD